MHGSTLSLAGPVYWMFLGFTALVVGLAVFVLVDLARARHRAFQGTPVVRAAWGIPQAALLIAAVLASTPNVVNATIGGVLAALLVPVHVVQVAYLLRVVFPSPARLARREVGVTGAPAADEMGTE
ncbi:MAG: hypothetical protein L6413_05090 [Coriobacteriia bacterium]|nr:hypothetical protein [Coriobacteriia bacterium]